MATRQKRQIIDAWDVDDDGPKLAVHPPLAVPTTDEWNYVNTSDFRQSRVKYRCDPKVTLLSNKDKISYGGVLAFAKGSPGFEEEVFIGRFPTSEPALLPPASKPTPSIRLVMGMPGDAEPFVGIGFRIPRNVNPAWSFFDRDAAKEQFHQAYLRFRCDDFEMRWKVLNKDELAVMENFFAFPQDKPIIAMRFHLLEGKQPLALNCSWPIFAADGAAKLIADELSNVIAAKHWTLYALDDKIYRDKFDRIGRTFAEVGRGPNLNQYLMRGRVNLQWNPPEMMKYCSNQPGMKGYPDFYNHMIKFHSWSQLHLREGWGTAFDHLWTEQYAVLLRSTPLASQWIHDVKGRKARYTVSVTIPDLGINASTLLKVEDELEIVFVPKVNTTLFDENGERLKEPNGWKGMIVERNLINHTGTHLLRVSRPYNDSVPDEQQIVSYDQWFKWCSYTTIYIRLLENTKTVKARLNALNMMAPEVKASALSRPARNQWRNDETLQEILQYETHDSEIYGSEQEIDQNNLRSIFQGCNVDQPVSYNFLRDISSEEMDKILSSLTDAQREGIKQVLPDCPNGVLCIHGCAGAGKTTCMIAIMFLQLARNLKLLVCSSTNPATNNVCNRFADQDAEEEYLKIRLHPEQFEFTEILCFDPIKEAQCNWSSSKNMKRTAKFGWEHSLACTVLKVTEFIPTKNQKLLSMIGKFDCLRDSLRKPIIDRNEEDLRHLKSSLKTCAVELLTSADVVFTTCITATAKSLQEFRDLVDMIFLDEAGSMTSADAMIPLKGDLPLVMAGDTKQPSSPCISANMRYATGKKVNPFSGQAKLSPLERFRDMGWPYWVIPKQCRIEPGLFDLPDYLFYQNKISYDPGNKLSAEAVAFDEWFVEFSQPFESTTPVVSSPHTIDNSKKVYSKVFPALIAIRNSYTYREPRGTSRGNSHFLHAGLLSLKSFIKKTGTATSDIGVMCPYQRQVSAWTEAIAGDDELGGVTVYTADSLKGQEKLYIWFDSTVGANVGGHYACLADSRRLCVFLTRHKKGLVIIGDPSLVATGRDYTQQEVGNFDAPANTPAEEEGIAEVADASTLANMFKWLNDRGRTLSLDVLKCDPRNALCTIVTPELIAADKLRVAEERRTTASVLQRQGFGDLQPGGV